ncbi:50S ribosome-binding GTPase [Corynebacterium aquatimens]|uniref:GTPase family protein n=1 Tax=Corynebacterium TaxID=1716 RepID=UPI001F212406|nr:MULTISPECIES: GTPase [Corynebacterium]QYH20258.1 50S ribosome-binding GTPase [Corynebacterium aquatimens]UIZ92475.1 50S ribosome-binding GTPase [Corynebacterium sp. CNCTC7651]
MFKRTAPLGDRLTALDEAAQLAQPYLPQGQLARIQQVATAGAERRALSGDHTVVGFFGATGSGKTSLFNAVVGEDLGKAAARRPTTSSPLAAIWQPEGSEQLLDWLGVEDRRTRPGEFAPGAGPLILLDLPDFDSVEASNRAIAERLAGQVDVLVWVSDPEKYADSVIHDEFIRPHASHSAVTLAVLNKADLLHASDVPTVARSFEELLRNDGLSKVRVIPTSTVTGYGIEDIRAAIAKVAKAHTAQSARIEADIHAVTRDFSALGKAGSVDKQAKRSMDATLAQAAGAERIAETTAAAYRKRLHERTGWLLTSWITRFRPDPLKRLGLREEADTVGVHRTSMPELDAASKAVANRGLREYSAAAAAGLPHAWGTAVADRTEQISQALPAELDRAVARTRLPAEPSKGWSVLTVLQWLALLAALVGVIWYLLVAMVPGVLTPLLGADLVPEVEGWPIPTLLIMAGLLTGLVIGLITAIFGGAIGSGVKRRTRQAVQREVAAISQTAVVEPLEAIRADYDRFAEKIAVAAR